MGPRSRDRGIGHGRQHYHPAAGLQWGRDHVIAELMARSRIERITRKLQWGRDHVIAEFKREMQRKRALKGFNGAAIT